MVWQEKEESMLENAISDIPPEWSGWAVHWHSRWVVGEVEKGMGYSVCSKKVAGACEMGTVRGWGCLGMDVAFQAVAGSQLPVLGT